MRQQFEQLLKSMQQAMIDFGRARWRQRDLGTKSVFRDERFTIAVLSFHSSRGTVID